MAAFAPATQAHINEALPRKTNRAGIWIMLILAALVAMIVLGVIAYLMRPQTFHCSKPVQCGTAPPVKTQPNPLPPAAKYTSPTYGFTVEYPQDYSPDQTGDNGIAWSGTYDQGPATWTFIGDSPNGRSPQQVVNDLQQNHFSDAQFAYAIPGADIGYTPGYGAVYDLFVNDATGQSVHQRLILISAIKNDTAISFIGTGPFVQESQQNDGHPNPAETPMVHEDLFREAIEGVTWRGQPQL